ncbi:uncharacterized protein METZ01_LOCUS132422 [marine metagenome]|uniref:Uncharacterized protein n=1 Tax=marine metagenome TaxID=408172 RepID=A0A381YRB7_9ZZZZ
MLLDNRIYNIHTYSRIVNEYSLNTAKLGMNMSEIQSDIVKTYRESGG